MQLFHSFLAILNGMSPYILLGFFIAGLLHAFVSPNLMAKHLAGSGIGSVVKSALLGIPLPLCSCGVLPTAVSLKRNGASNAATTSFLIATPQTGVDSVAATWSLLGPAMAIVRPAAALVCSVFGGWSVGKYCTEESDFGHTDTCHDHHDECSCDGCHDESHTTKSFADKMLTALRYGFVDMISHVGKWLVIGLVVATLITVFVPNDMFVGLSRYPILAMLAMVAVAIPMYICATGSIPIAMTLILKGFTPGVAFVMLMAGPAANFASVMVLRRSLGVKATTIYIGSVVLTALAFGLLIDHILPQSWFALPNNVAGCCHGDMSFGWFESVCSIALILLLAYALYKSKSNKRQIPIEMEKKTYKIEGMMCPHCQANVQKGLESLPGVDLVVVDLGKGTADVSGEASPEAIIAKISSLGYEAKLN